MIVLTSKDVVRIASIEVKCLEQSLTFSISIYMTLYVYAIFDSFAFFREGILYCCST